MSADAELRRRREAGAYIANDGGVYPVWSPDGSMIAYVKYDLWGSEEDGDGQLWVMNADGTGKKQLTFVRR